MIDQLKKLVENYAGDEIIRNSEVPDEKNEAAIEAVTSGISDGLQQEVKQGNFEGLLSMFQQGGTSKLASNPAVSGIVNNVVSSLSTKLGISPQIAQTIAASLIPKVMSSFVNKTNDPDDKDFDLQDMLKNFSGGDGLDIGDILGKFSGGSQSSSSGGGGIGDMLGKVLGGK